MGFISGILGLFTGGKWVMTLALLAVVFAVGGMIGWHERVLREPGMLDEQKKSDNQQCNTDKLITKEANDDLQKDRDAISAKLAALELQHPATCIPVTGKAQLPAGTGQHAGQNGAGVSSDWLREYAAECEGYRSEVTTCIDFVNQTWKAAGQ